MIVRDAGDSWQVVLQTDHAVLSGQFAEAWGNDRFERVRPFRSVVTATLRHDDGWAVWERAPSIMAWNGDVKPRNFLDVQVGSHLAFYRAMIASVRDDDPYAGLLVSMHGAGIYNGRYGTQPSLRLTFADDERQQVEAFVQEQEASYPGAIASLGAAEEERWANYKLLQIFDRLSLHFCMKDADRGEADVLTPVPVDYAGTETELRIEPDGPWSIRLDPFPFAGELASFTLVRRVIPKRAWADHDEFRRDFFAAEPQTMAITARAA
jgi:Protein of unknown function (DUF3891)